MSDTVNYATIKALAAGTKGVTVADLIALAPHRDPFYIGSPGEVRKAEWFASLWERFGYTTGVHLRRVHYQLVSQNPPVLKPNGKGRAKALDNTRALAEEWMRRWKEEHADTRRFEVPAAQLPLF